MVSVKGYLSKSILTIENEGIVAFLTKSLRKVETILYATNSAYWYKGELSQYRPPISSSIDIELDFDNERILEWLHANNSLYRWLYIPEEIKIAQEHKHIFLTVLHNHTIIGYIKVAIEKVFINDFKRVFILPLSVAYIYDSFILTEYRGRDIIPFAIDKLCHYLRNKDIKEIYCHIPEWNKSSIRAYEKAGFRRIMHIRFIRLLNLSFFIKDARKLTLNMDRLFSGFQN
jgi:RimJ/RimL family protein N-acetyltransferase